jgi:ubiquinone/menaquinone biosynthesis C-methylase UbiE
MEGTMAIDANGLFSEEYLKLKYDNEVMYQWWVDEYYGNSDFANFGYWDERTLTQKEACENLMEKALTLIPDKKGTILDVACGKGATTRYLLKYYSPEAITGINISERQLETCRKNAPGCEFLLMNATELTFKDNWFNNIICIEAALHFNTRKLFLEQALRVLKPGGYLVLTDALIRKWIEETSSTLCAENHIPSLEEYRLVLRRIGFQEIEIHDVTDQCWSGWDAHLAGFVQEKFEKEEFSRQNYRAITAMRRFTARSVRHYLLAAGRKPE